MRTTSAGGAPAPAAAPHGVPLWPPSASTSSAGGVSALVSERSTVGPRWLVPALLVGLLGALGLARRAGAPRLVRGLGLLLAAAVTAATVSSAALLLVGLQNERRSADRLLADAGLIWVANVLTFALWYWELDGGGPFRRAAGAGGALDLQFPQQAAEAPGGAAWRPGLVDYRFVAFTTATAFSPTDTMPLSGRAKLLMMAEAALSLVVFGVLAARAIGMF